MKKLILLILLTIPTIFSCRRKTYPEVITPTGDTTSIAEVYEARHLQAADGALPYRVARLNPNSSTEKPALVLYLHSANGRGSDNISQFRHQKAIDSIYNYLTKHRMNVMFLVPQCPSDKTWAGNRQYQSYLGPVKELLRGNVRHHSKLKSSSKLRTVVHYRTFAMGFRT
ncbi:MAG: hypothetical protein K6A73_08635 [Bacteroidales bacterium]|nr:hypothetical protein [Bacteroidales bacterium]